MTPSAVRNVPALLQQLRDERFSGTVRVSGHPGGTIHLRDGLIGAIETPGAPTVTSTLLTSGRITDEDWLAATAAEPDADRLGGHLVATGLIGAAEFEVCCAAAVFDGAFAMALSPPGEREVSGPEPALVAEPGFEPRQLTEETARRTAWLTRLWGPPSELTRVRPERVESPETAAGWLAPRQQDVLGCVNGRRTARDIAFTLGRGLYAVLLDLVRLESLGLVRWQPRPASDTRPSTAPRVPRTDTSATGAVPKTTALPKRRPGSGLPGRDPGQKGRGG
ncbi:hypothetical protein ABZ896_20275 [Streptomyces sp. NPDC047072]|uniref:hypothetical protein n=1 Tax=Streptomyces sp. NPDC047072 TaxID=3154809 RepID=UPI00340B74C6